MHGEGHMLRRVFVARRAYAKETHDTAQLDAGVQHAAA